MKKKICNSCKEEKSLRNFHKDKRSPDKKGYSCKLCIKARQRSRYLEFPERVLNINRRWTHANKDAVREINRKWKRENREHVRSRDRAWRARNKEKVIEIHRRYRAKYPDRYLNYKLRRDFGITVEDYRKILLVQNGICAGCLNPPTEKRRLCVDHDHNTGIVRGLLCHKCNVAIGYGMDSPEILRRLAEYLEKKGVNWRKTNVDAVNA